MCAPHLFWKCQNEKGLKHTSFWNCTAVYTNVQKSYRLKTWGVDVKQAGRSLHIRQKPGACDGECEATASGFDREVAAQKLSHSQHKRQPVSDSHASFSQHSKSKKQQINPFFPHVLTTALCFMPKKKLLL